MGSRFRYALLAAVAIGTLVPAAPALAADERRVEYNIEAGDLGEALKTVSRLSRKEIIFNSQAVLGRSAPRLRGTYSANEAVRALLEGSGLTAQYRKDVVIIRGRSGPPGEVAGRSAGDADIVVTGSHIRGGEGISPMVVASKTAIEKRGISDLGSFARSLVQNYSGGQNPGVAAGGQGGSENVTSSSTLNLRGLGADATLTLFNGHRVAYDAISQGVDISAVPLAAVERVEVVTDGSSALYGSDAVGGVANVVLRRDFDGAIVSARVGGATDGGNFEQQYNLVTGRRWSTGGFMAAVDYRHTTPIKAGDRSYTQSNHPSETLQSGMTQYSAVLAGHQNLSEGVALELDAQFSKRDSSLCVNYTVTDGCLVSGTNINVDTRSWTVAPALKVAVGSAWEVRLAGVIGESRVNQNAAIAFDGSFFLVQKGLYTNRIRSVELGADGPLFELPGGDARIALGGGVRDTRLIIDVATIESGTATPSLNFVESRPVHYGFAEVSLPFISASNEIPFVNRLSLSAAMRYEDVGGVGDVATPKFGVAYSPVRDIALKFSWGKSFKAPTLYQSGQPRQGASQPGETFFLPPSPVPGAVLYLIGGNPELKPERATNWTATASFTPSFAEGLRVDVSLFRIKYRDRAVSPIPLNSLAFLPIYSPYITLNPTREQVLAALSGLSAIYDQGGGDPTTAPVGAIVTNYLQNAARQKIEGVDIAADYAFSLGDRDHFHLVGAASYLKSIQQLTADQPSVQLAGIIFRQPHWRASSSLEWQRGGFSLSGVLSYIGGSLDNRVAPFQRVGSFATFDLVGRFETGDVGGPLANTTFLVSALNVFNKKPPFIRTISPIGYNYDSNNFPSTGRFLSLSISKSF
ncbi:TonB-dependent receptor [Sphingomonas sp. AP4-R1]|uniref:TonB-dependent receptor n=1 Tax=Sphingomonas sp. AP4-R1 TaxID=2735134 RepID=UPI001493BDDF|nr:TonB-dependent receptor [Sphingomonas sp. AP4-R1]QJU58447.1 TonB-dependent receptor [Sphingomonas sp. AP4-R1]